MTITSAATSVNKSKPPAIVNLIKKINGFHDGQRILDYGCGKYPEVTERAIMEDYDVIYSGYDPHNRNSEENNEALKRFRKADVVLLSNVLNVLQHKAVQAATVIKAYQELAMGGTLYITVYEGDKSGSGRVTKKDCWQENRKTEDYMDMLRDIFPHTERKGKLIIVYKTKEI
jgi:hypothetical protein